MTAEGDDLEKRARRWADTAQQACEALDWPELAAFGRAERAAALRECAERLEEWAHESAGDAARESHEGNIDLAELCRAEVRVLRRSAEKLRSLSPAPPPAAEECKTCAGTGRVSYASGASAPCPWCGPTDPPAAVEPASTGMDWRDAYMEGRWACARDIAETCERLAKDEAMYGDASTSTGLMRAVRVARSRDSAEGRAELAARENEAPPAAEEPSRPRVSEAEMERRRPLSIADRAASSNERVAETGARRVVTPAREHEQRPGQEPSAATALTSPRQDTGSAPPHEEIPPRGNDDISPRSGEVRCPPPAPAALSREALLECVRRNVDSIPFAIGDVLRERLVQRMVELQLSLLRERAAPSGHRACTNEEHDPAQGKLAGFCVVCGVPWPCGTSARAAPSEAETLERCLDIANRRDAEWRRCADEPVKYAQDEAGRMYSLARKSEAYAIAEEIRALRSAPAAAGREEDDERWAQEAVRRSDAEGGSTVTLDAYLTSRSDSSVEFPASAPSPAQSPADAEDPFEAAALKWFGVVEMLKGDIAIEVVGRARESATALAAELRACFGGWREALEFYAGIPDGYGDRARAALRPPQAPAGTARLP